ncbi:MAG TPA: TrkA C-terminal domain-containing protein, partial [Acidimicrobiia bacterium]|nr:TrkA C-terminal domain-containing protein [Acidimicrobiia bacterium]
ETTLPGVGVRYDFQTAQGTRIGVLVHRTGRRDLLVYALDDPDSLTAQLGLEPDDARTLAELLGASRIAEHLAAVQQDIEGLSIDWIVIDDGAEWAGASLRDAGVHTNTGVSVVALLGGDRAIAAPGAEDVLAPGSTAVAVGTPEGLQQLTAKVKRG